VQVSCQVYSYWDGQTLASSVLSSSSAYWVGIRYTSVRKFLLDHLYSICRFFRFYASVFLCDRLNVSKSSWAIWQSIERNLLHSGFSSIAHIVGDRYLMPALSTCFFVLWQKSCIICQSSFVTTLSPLCLTTVLYNVEGVVLAYSINDSTSLFNFDKNVQWLGQLKYALIRV